MRIDRIQSVLRSSGGPLSVLGADNLRGNRRSGSRLRATSVEVEDVTPFKQEQTIMSQT